MEKESGIIKELAKCGEQHDVMNASKIGLLSPFPNQPSSFYLRRSVPL